MSQDNRVNMMNVLKKRLKSMMGNEENSIQPNEEKFELKENVNEVEVTAKKVTSMIPLEEVQELCCDICKEKSIVLKNFNFKKIQEDGTEILKYKEPITKYVQGSNYKGVLMCDKCANMCNTTDQKDFMWVYGMVNILEETNEKIEDKRKELYGKIDVIRAEAEEQINELLRQDNELIAEIEEIKTNREQLIQHQEILGNKIASGETSSENQEEIVAGDQGGFRAPDEFSVANM